MIKLSGAYQLHINWVSYYYNHSLL